MDLYLFTGLLGFGGLLLTAIFGLSHGGHHGSAGANHGGHHLHLGKFKLRPAHHLPSASKQVSGGHVSLLRFLEPQVIFSLLLGFGLTGLLLRSLVHEPLTVLGLALLAAWFFQSEVVEPLCDFLFNFASQPACTLESLVSAEAAAVTDFDDAGHGLVTVDLDGQTRQILGKLCREERASGTRVRTGDRLFIRAVDGARNTCTVSRLSC